MSMNWNDVIQKDFTLTRTARQLASVISANFTASNCRYVRFYDSDLCGTLDTNSTAVRIARHELQRRGYLYELHSPAGRPSYAMRLGFPEYADGEDAA